MKPPGMEAFNSTLTDVRPGQSFTDVTVLDGTTVKVGHSLEKLDEHRTRVIYHTDELGQAEAETGSMVTADFDDVLEALKQLAECSSPQEFAGTHMRQPPAHPNEDHMEIRAINAPDAPRAAGSYAQACEVVGASRLLFVSGQVPLTRNDELPSTFGEQCRLAWANVEAQLRAADMELTNLVKVTIFLSDREYAVENRAVRQGILGLHSPALTVIIAGSLKRRGCSKSRLSPPPNPIPTRPGKISERSKMLTTSVSIKLHRIWCAIRMCATTRA